MDFKEYRERRQKWRLNEKGLVMPTWLVVAGVVGEMGEVVDLIKKEQWHGLQVQDKMVKELGDLLWYLDEVCQQEGSPSLDVVAVVRCMSADNHERLVHHAKKAIGELAVGNYHYDLAFRFVVKTADFYKIETSTILQANVDKLEERYPNGFVLGGGNR